MYIRHEIPFTIRHDVDCFDSEMESIFIEIDRLVFQTPSNIVIGLIYKMPDASVGIFNERITDILNIIDSENFFLSYWYILIFLSVNHTSQHLLS